MNKLKRNILAILSSLMLIFAVIPIYETHQAWDVMKFLACDIKEIKPLTKPLYKLATTDQLAYELFSKSAIGSTEERDSNVFNALLELSGYKIRAKDPGGVDVNPFAYFGFAGLNYTSYSGEFMYFDIDPCTNDGRPESDKKTVEVDKELSEEAKEWAKTYSIHYIGDSLGVGVQDFLSKHFGDKTRFDSVVSRNLSGSTPTVPDAFEALEGQNLGHGLGHPTTLVVALGTNNGLPKEKFIEFLDKAEKYYDKIVWINTHAADAHVNKEQMNELIKSESETRESLYYLDWDKQAPEFGWDSFVSSDGIHMDDYTRYGEFHVQGLYQLIKGEDKKDEKAPLLSDFGEYYPGRKNPQTTYGEIASSKDVRTIQKTKGWFSSFVLSFQDTIANLLLFLSKFIIAVVISLIGITLGRGAEMFGIDSTIQEGIFLQLYNSLLLPMVGGMMVLTAIYLIWRGLIKGEVRTALIEGIFKTMATLFLAIFLSLNPKYLTIPNDVATVGQAMIIQGISPAVKGSAATSLCSATSDLSGWDVNDPDFFVFVAVKTKEMIGCTMWEQFLFRPWVIGQFGTEYENLNELPNVNKRWVLDPEVSMGGRVKQTNWALFHLSVLSGYHEPLDDKYTPLVGGVNKDWYRIVDALSNYDEVEKQVGKDGKSALGGDGGSTTGGLEDEWITPGTEKYKIAKQMFDFMTKEKGTSGAFAAGVLGNVYHESYFVPDLAERSYKTSIPGPIRFGMDSDVKPDGAGISIGHARENEPDFFGGGFWQTTPYTHYTKSRFWRKDGKQGWDPGNQLDFLFADEFENRAVEDFLRSTDPSHGMAMYGWPVIFNNMEEWYSTMNVEDATKAFMGGYLRPAASAANYPTRLKAAQKADEVFNKEKIKADPSKWKFSNQGVGGPGGSSSSSQVSGDLKVFEQVLNSPLEQWSYWIGNHNTERIWQALLSLVLVIIGSIGPIVFGVLSAAYSIGLSIIVIFSPIFLLLGLWAGKGHQLFKSYVALIVETMIKKIVAALLLMLSIILTSNMVKLIHDMGLLKAIVFTFIIIYVLISRRHEIINKIAKLNVNTLHLAGVAKSMAMAKGSAKFTAGAIATTTSAIKTSKQNGGSIKQGAKVGMSTFIKNELYRTNMGRKAMTTYDQQIKHNTQETCLQCGTSIKIGSTGFRDSIGNYYCEECAMTLKNFDNLTQTTLSDPSANTIEFTQSEAQYSNRNENDEFSKQYDSYEQPTYASFREKTKLTETSWDKEAAQDEIARSIDLINKDIEYIKQLNADRSKTSKEYKFGSAVIPDPIREFINAGELQALLNSGKNDEYLEKVKDGWTQWYMMTGLNRGENKEDLLKDLEKLNLKDEDKDEK